MIRGVVIGKFYPPHLGHSYLIETALSHTDHLDVLVCVRPDQTILGNLRAQWLKETHPKANVIAIPDLCDDENSERWAEFTVQTLGYQPNLVFTSENYGERYALAMNATHIMVDLHRNHVPVSASAIRANPLAYLEYLAPAVRAFYVKRVCLVGAESTGTTTMSSLLADHYQTTWVPSTAEITLWPSSAGNQPNQSRSSGHRRSFCILLRRSAKWRIWLLELPTAY